MPIFHTVSPIGPSHVARCRTCGGDVPFATASSAERSAREAADAGLRAERTVEACECASICECAR